MIKNNRSRCFPLLLFYLQKMINRLTNKDTFGIIVNGTNDPLFKVGNNEKEKHRILRANCKIY